MENTKENLEQSEAVRQEIAATTTDATNVDAEKANEDAEASEETDADDVMTETLAETVLKRFPKVCERIAEIMNSHAEDVALELIRKGLDYDDAVANADKEGYVRGKNEKIELVKGHRMPQLDAEITDDSAAKEVLFPKYTKRSVWE